MRWPGLNLRDVPLGTAMSAVVAFGFAFYTGPLINLRLRRLLVAGAVLAFWQPATAFPRTESQLPAARAVSKAKDPSKQEGQVPDVSLRLTYWPSLSVQLVNLSGATVNEPGYDPVVWDLDSASDTPLPVHGEKLTHDSMDPHNAVGPWTLTNSLLKPNVKVAQTGDRIFGFVTATCSNCKRTRSYWVYAVEGKPESAWYAEMPAARQPDALTIAKRLPEIRKDPEAFFADVKLEDRRQPVKSPDEGLD